MFDLPGAIVMNVGPSGLNIGKETNVETFEPLGGIVYKVEMFNPQGILLIKEGTERDQSLVVTNMCPSG